MANIPAILPMTLRGLKNAAIVTARGRLFYISNPAAWRNIRAARF
jgi:hypothetical protein